jgi:hypothetical protein
MCPDGDADHTPPAGHRYSYAAAVQIGKTRATAMFTVAGLVLVLGAGCTTGQSGSPPVAGNRSTNPVLADNLRGWTIVEGATGLTQVSVDDHVDALNAAQVTSSATTTRVGMPANQPVSANQVWMFAADVKATQPGAQASVSVSWTGIDGGFIDSDEGRFVDLNNATWIRAFVTAPAPPGAVEARSQVNVIHSAPGQQVTITAQDIRMVGNRLFNGDFETGDFSQYLTCQTKSYDGDCDKMPQENDSLVIEPRDQGKYAAQLTVRDGDIPFCCGERAQLVAYDTRGSPPLGFYVEGNNLMLQTRPRPGAPFTGITNIWTKPFVKGQWMDLKLHVKWSADPKVGFVEIWANGERQTFAATPTEHGNGVSCVGQDRCGFRNIYPGDPGNRAVLTYYRDPVINGTGVVHHDNFDVADTEAALNSSR